MKNLGRYLKYYRNIRGYTQEQLAEKVGISTEFIKSIENKNKTPRLENFVKICNTLSIPADFLLRDEIMASEINMIDYLIKEFGKYSDEERLFYVEALQYIIEHKNKYKDDED